MTYTRRPFPFSLTLKKSGLVHGSLVMQSVYSVPRAPLSFFFVIISMASVTGWPHDHKMATAVPTIMALFLLVEKSNSFPGATVNWTELHLIGQNLFTCPPLPTREPGKNLVSQQSTLLVPIIPILL